MSQKCTIQPHTPLNVKMYECEIPKRCFMPKLVEIGSLTLERTSEQFTTTMQQRRTNEL